MRNPIICHYINAKAAENYATKMQNEFRNQGWNFVSIISNSDLNIEEYLFQRKS